MSLQDLSIKPPPEPHVPMCAQYMGVSKPSSAKRGFLRRLLRDVEEHGDKKLELAGYDRLLGDPDYYQLKQLTSLDAHQMLKRYTSKLHLRSDDAHTGALNAVVEGLLDSRVPSLCEVDACSLTARSGGCIRWC